MKKQFASADLTAGQLNAIVKKLGGHEGALKFLRGELSVFEPICNGREADAAVYFSVTSDGTTGEEWITRLEQKGLGVTDGAKSLLHSPDFKPTTGVKTAVVVLKGSLFKFKAKDRTIKKIRTQAKKQKLVDPNAEVACLIRDKFTDKELEAMGFDWVIIMHEPIKDSDDIPNLLGVSRGDDGPFLDAYDDFSLTCRFTEYGFALTVS